MIKKKQKIAVGMSGGVDSSVSAALLLKQGYDVIGVFMKFSDNKDGENVCCSLESKMDAERVCRKLGIKLYVMNMQVNFKKKVIDDFICKYKSGKTPNPCVLCNRYIKFGDFIKKAKLLKCDFVATGHYSKVKKNRKGVVSLLKGKDKNKDQSYFLNQLKQTQLKHIMFPVGGYTKDQVRKLAKKYGLSTASKKESQEVCFVPDNNLSKFLKSKIKFQQGEMKEFGTKNILGLHKGLPLYTIGQRKGIGLPGGPWYVAELDMKKNVLWVTKDQSQIDSKTLSIKKINWMVEEPPLPTKVKCKVRYRTAEVSATITKKANKYIVQFNKPIRAITSGQFAVFYKGQECLGGGEIS